jgi:hypothetical protein
MRAIGVNKGRNQHNRAAVGSNGLTQGLSTHSLREVGPGAEGWCAPRARGFQTQASTSVSISLAEKERPLLERLDVVAKEGTKDVCTQQPNPEQDFEDVKHRPQLEDILLSISVPPVGLTGRAPTRNHSGRCTDVILQEEPLPPPHGWQVGHRELEVRVDLTASPDLNVNAAAHRHLYARVLSESDMEEVVP